MERVPARSLVTVVLQLVPRLQKVSCAPEVVSYRPSWYPSPATSAVEVAVKVTDLPGATIEGELARATPNQATVAEFDVTVFFIGWLATGGVIYAAKV